jgi:hypothetical protein
LSNNMTITLWWLEFIWRMIQNWARTLQEYTVSALPTESTIYGNITLHSEN